ncbi:MAG: Na(+)/H(+) antiporter subunit F [Candidatus Margulisbacteria bacterium]|nr:Na(+)/H(+) antiporter subunit F [Candidatus Margulisiibacteriota bacterium]
MTDTILNIGIGILCVSTLFGMIRMAKGPTVFDRILSYDVIALCMISIMILVSMKWKTALYFDIILVFGIFGFISTLSFSYFFTKTEHLTEESRKGDST